MARFCLQLNAGGISRNVGMGFAKESTQAKNNSTKIERVELPDKVKNSRILVLGGTGRVGGSTAIALSKYCPDLRIVIAGRNRYVCVCVYMCICLYKRYQNEEYVLQRRCSSWIIRDKGAAMVTKLGNNSEFSEVDINDTKSLEEALRDVDLVIHTAGPFQQTEKCTVLEAAIQNKTAYLDVCDDTSYAQRAKSYMNKARDANIPAITTGGIYPGVSNVMAAELVCAAKSENKGEPKRLRFYYYTAGSGGAGPTILSTSFLLLGEEVVAYNKGEKIILKPYSGMLNIDFGLGIGKQDVFLLNLPEVRSVHEVLGVPTVSARFGTSPFFWNWGMVAMTYLLPAETLRDRSKVQQLVQLFDPLVRAVDEFAGEKVSMRVDLESSDGRNRIGIFSHKRLSESVGISTAAFALAILEGSTKPGVWFPEEGTMDG
ncbi:hypothetical protein BUALT_Bualt02G0180600 [Buddleja alternifolia]|uniref:Saccharopine dehydrogenase NADP binding domain-containing protein n=1 Tax=Buddleja alternifolia TaxID=168488 RepID=A0AAV6Y5E0_9LAMI|nr:hypothetical protein BUALT_Bualt02G0180600 [Buddleja alternifolia]